jgi:hypothetical protein
MGRASFNMLHLDHHISNGKQAGKQTISSLQMEVETRDCGKLLHRNQNSKSPRRIVEMVSLDCTMWTTATTTFGQTRSI